MEDWITTAYWFCLLVGILYTVLALLLGGIANFAGHAAGFHAGSGGFSHNYGVSGHSGHGDSHGSTPGGGQVIFGPFSPLVIAFFLTCFGAFGVLMQLVYHVEIVLGLGVSLAMALVMAWVLIMLGNRLIGGMQSSSEVHVQALIGTEAEVTVAIPETAIGEVAYVAMGGRSVSPARSEDQTPIPRFSTVRITRVVGSIFFVRPVVDEQLRALDTLMPNDSVTRPHE